MAKIYTPTTSKLQLKAKRADLEKELEQIRDRYANESTGELAARMDLIADAIGAIDLKLMRMDGTGPSDTNSDSN